MLICPNASVSRQGPRFSTARTSTAAPQRLRAWLKVPRQSVLPCQYRTASRASHPATTVPAALNIVRATGSGSRASRLKSSAAKGGYVNGSWGPPAQSMLPR
ncbi:hypothetical protein D3C84_1027070 [compost metagenome]